MILDNINQRFIHGIPSDDLDDAGVVVHQTDCPYENLPWLPCDEYSKNVATSIVNRKWHYMFSTSAIGFVANPIVATKAFLCAGSVDLASFEDWNGCNGNTWGIVYKSSKEMLDQNLTDYMYDLGELDRPYTHSDRSGRKYNEVLLNGTTWTQNISETIDAVFYPINGLVNHEEGNEEIAIATHSQFLKQYNLGEDAYPLLTFDIFKAKLGEPPFQLSTHQALHPSSLTSSTASICRWLVVAGDSTMREIAHMLIARERAESKGSFRTKRAARLGNFRRSEHCDEGWADREWVLGTEQSCSIVTLKFLNDQNDTSRLNQDMLNSTFCGTVLEKPLRQNQIRPKHPDMIWFSHGLRGVPNSGENTQGLKCSTYFGGVLEPLIKLNRRSSVVWQTNFPITVQEEDPSSVSNEYLDWDIRCQRATARVWNITLYDINNLVASAFPSPDETYRLEQLFLKQATKDIRNLWNTGQLLR